MSKSNKNILFGVLILFAAYCSISIGLSWDELTLSNQGKIALSYLLSLGTIEPDEVFRREFYSPIYYALRYLFIQIFPVSYHIEAGHVVNLAVSIAAVIGLKKLCTFLFNKKVGMFAFLILFFFPAFFGHMGFNSKDTVVAFCHIWIFYLTLKYVKSHKSKYLYFVGILAAIGTGINLFFLGSLIPLFIFLIVELFLLKKINTRKIPLKKLLKETLFAFLIFYSILILFWIDTHPNILMLPIKFFSDWAFSDLWRGYPFMLLNGEYYNYSEIPKSYLLINILFRSPEYLLFCYFVFIFLLIGSRDFFNLKISSFNYKLILILSMVLYPFLLLYFTPFSIYDGLRHVLWILPYLCIVPALAIFYIFENINLIKVKVISSFLLILISYFIYNFLMTTPYQYTYLNILAGGKKNHYNKFENDYWGGSVKELIRKVDLPKNTDFKFAVCGVSKAAPEFYLKKFGYTNFSMGNENNSEYIIMTNRTTIDKNNKLTNCFNKFRGENIFKVSRNNVDLSVIRKIN